MEDFNITVSCGDATEQISKIRYVVERGSNSYLVTYGKEEKISNERRDEEVDSLFCEHGDSIIYTKNGITYFFGI